MRARFHLIREHRLHGTVTGLERVRTLASIDDSLDRLLVSFKDAKVSSFLCLICTVAERMRGDCSAGVVGRDVRPPHCIPAHVRARAAIGAYPSLNLVRGRAYDFASAQLGCTSPSAPAPRRPSFPTLRALPPARCPRHHSLSHNANGLRPRPRHGGGVGCTLPVNLFDYIISQDIC
jgi:hypothetical protein